MQTWGMDGTFKVVPQWYQQLFTIHAFVAGKLVPAVYCLCTGKDIGTYGPDTRDSGLLPEYAGTGLLLPLLPGGT
ncbi:tRNA dimethylallyltransferase [Trichinella spiralis]|uniref:tRNA dimethylallyltransferase n=1 Tax=Trichinella spiralis TaxID=6334 RepID=A0ABR3KEQ6_TRISP